MASDRLARETFDHLRLHMAPGLALGAKMIGRGAVESSASGAVVELSDGRRLVDFGSYAVTLLGHAYGPVVEAAAHQLRVMPASTRVLANPVAAQFAAELTARCGPPFDGVWLGSDGADAVEVAAKLARRVTGRRRILAVRGAFHGKTLGALALTWNPAFRIGLEPFLSHVTHVDPADPDAVGREVARGDVAALIFEPIQAENGVRPLAPELLRAWAGEARSSGAFVISDEVQVGLRRCGALSLAIEWGLEPDAVLFGKALGGGVVPLSAMVATAALRRPLTADPTWHTSTFGAHPLSCAAGRAALTAIDALASRADALGRRFESELRAVAERYPDVVTAVRGRGLIWGVEAVSPGAAGNLLLELAEHGLLVSPCLSSQDTLRLLPPMTTTDDDLARALGALTGALEATREFATTG